MTYPWSGSATERVLACPASAALPAVHAPSSADASDGSVLHEFIYTGALRGREAALAGVTDPHLHARAARIDLGRLASIGRIVGAEEAYAYDVAVDSARHLGRNLGRNYGALNGTEIPTTTDLELVAPDGVRVLLDAKTGWAHVASDSDQLRFHALACLTARGLDRVRVGVLRVGADGQLDDPRLVEIDDLDAGAFAHELRQAHESYLAARAAILAGGAPNVTTGLHCQYCPAYAACPSTVALARSVLSLAPVDLESAIELMTPNEAGELWERYSAGEKLLERIGKGLRAYAAREPLVLPDGATLEMVEQIQVRAVMVPDPSGATKTITFPKATIRGRKKKGRAA